jgi:diguanylate cyclase (GGDEF)-like protein
MGAEKGEVIGKNFRKFKFFENLAESVTQSIMNNADVLERVIYDDRHLEALIRPYSRDGQLEFIRIILRDVTKFVSLEKELLKRNHELVIISTLSSAFISSENMDLVIEDLMDKILLVTGTKIGWLLLRDGKEFSLKSSRGISSEIVKNIRGETFHSIINKVISSQEPLYIMEDQEIAEIEMLHEDGIVFLAALPLISERTSIGLLFLASRDMRSEHFDFDMATLFTLIGNNVSLILDKIKLFQETRRLAITDGLTGLYNRRYFYRHLSIEIARSKRYKTPFSLMMFDIDNFKEINDSYGHQAGDDVLMRLADVLRVQSRETDIIVRYGGEEFLIILPNTSEDEAFALANRIKNIVRKRNFSTEKDNGIYITLSGGIASYPKHAIEEKTLLNAADNALYCAKASGKNKIMCYRKL